MSKDLMVIIITHNGEAKKFYDCENLQYFGKKASFTYIGTFGKLTARFNDIAGVIEGDVPNPFITKEEK